MSVKVCDGDCGECPSVNVVVCEKSKKKNITRS